MDMDPNQRPQVDFSSDRPIEGLKQQHQFIKKLFDSYLKTQDVAVKRQAGPQILLQLEMHTALEESTFYPAVQKVDTTLVDECEDEHQQAKHQQRGRYRPADKWLGNVHRRATLSRSRLRGGRS